MNRGFCFCKVRAGFSLFVGLLYGESRSWGWMRGMLSSLQQELELECPRGVTSEAGNWCIPHSWINSSDVQLIFEECAVCPPWPWSGS